MTFRDKVIRSLDSLRLTITNDQGKEIAYLELVSRDDLNNEELIEKVTLWRELNKTCFLTEFVPTIERTKTWLEKSIVDNPERILFKIFTLDNILVGHIGAIFRGTYIEYDYYILGIKVDIKHFAITIARFFLLWLLEIENVSYVLGNVRSDNVHAMDFHIRTGFRVNRQVPLARIESQDNEVAFKEVTNESDASLYLVEIRATKSDLGGP
jgi:hypothetical protein